MFSEDSVGHKLRRPIVLSLEVRNPSREAAQGGSASLTPILAAPQARVTLNECHSLVAPCPTSLTDQALANFTLLSHSDTPGLMTCVDSTLGKSPVTTLVQDVKGHSVQNCTVHASALTCPS